MGLMLMDMFNFSIIFAFMIFGFASAFSMWFRDSVDSYSTLIKATVTLFSASLGEFDYEAFEGTEKQARGQICLTIFLGVSTVLLLNLLIAILSHRYEATQIQSYEEYHLGMVSERSEQRALWRKSAKEATNPLLLSSHASLKMRLASILLGAGQKLFSFEVGDGRNTQIRRATSERAECFPSPKLPPAVDLRRRG